MKEEKYDLEERLIAFAVRVIRMAESLPGTPVGRHITCQLIRSGTSPAPNYGEAQSAESQADFVHKLKIVLKELRETRVWLLMIRHAELVKPASRLADLIRESDELISIFVASVKTSKKKAAERRTAEPGEKRTAEPGEKRTAEPQNIEYRTAEVIRSEPGTAEVKAYSEGKLSQAE
jgi:four helix bundle protein